MIATGRIALGLKDRTIFIYCPYLFGPPVFKCLADCTTLQSIAKQFQSIFPAKNARVVAQGLSATRACGRIQAEIAPRFLVFRITGIDNLISQPVKFRLRKGTRCCNSPFSVELVVSMQFHIQISTIGKMDSALHTFICQGSSLQPECQVQFNSDPGFAFKFDPPVGPLFSRRFFSAGQS